MEEPRQIDLTYITERIITIFCPPECPDEIYLQNLQEILLMLQSKHGHHYMILDTGWVDHLAPDLDQMGGKGRLGVLVASYIHFSNMSASADLSLDHFAMRRFYNDKLSAQMTPSQKRHVNAAQTDRLYFVLQPAQLLKGDIMILARDDAKSLHNISQSTGGIGPKTPK
ncbi:hypothetical protein NQZ68_039767 [Dissostichus eleginoides]|nr:hypothetical protein NQZ68_039767 [Dissostichus eleginoides]